MWQKSRAMWLWAAENEMKEHDFFFISGDDALLLVGNLHHYLESLAGSSSFDSDTPRYIGRPFNLNGNEAERFVSGAGYLLSRGALQLFSQHANDAKCHPQSTTSAEDVMIGECLRSIGVSATDTQDAQGRDRFHWWNVASTANSELHPAFEKQNGGKHPWWERYSVHWKPGMDGISNESVLFHFENDPLAYRCFRSDTHFETQSQSAIESFHDT